ncbi:aromatic ring-hydroxylating dioxygenase subunit alpha [Pelagibius sp. Alg239-R121]|uniref:aromatic ring-hydroxylating oxygenase subunit alpha n=1 Tax=Pelagibius sp. Alg239-R121 TaxID=2993448 RepID=UPI0024A6AFCB|nr:aromatic ring-hydroxylating dioxygenase subunit alpha [Pelagibius sp. Alg239-R121]
MKLAETVSPDHVQPVEHNLMPALAAVPDGGCLPNPFYIEEAVFEEEKKRIFAPNWTCIGFGKDVPNIGDARPITFLGIPLLLLRDKSGQVRVFQNVCRHRGMTLVNEPTNFRGVIRCPYHSWCYSLDGALKTTPHLGGPGQNDHPAVSKSELGLYEVRSTVWMDLVFVNLSGDAPAFEDAAATLTSRWSEFEGQAIYHGGPDSSFSLTVASNWKLAVENYCESYHLPWIHPGLNSYSRLEDHYNIIESGDFSGQGTTVYNPSLDNSGRQFSHFKGLSEKWSTCAEYVALYPNVLVGIHKDHFFSILLEPVAQDKTVERVEIYYTSPEMTGGDWADLRARNSEMWKEIFVEDVGVVEGMQRGRHAPDFDGGTLSPVMDTATHAFHAWVADRYSRTAL